jgi:dCTP deaminase
MAEDILYLFPELEKDVYTSSNSSMKGALTSTKIRDMIEAGHILGDIPITEAQIQPASIDLRLGPTAYRVQASFLPGSSNTVLKKMQGLLMAEIDLTKPAVFEKGCVYIVPLMEKLNLPTGISAKANPRSTTGRLDIFTRLITDYGNEFERVTENYRGNLYAEVVPRTFTILVSQGTKLNQIRFMRGDSLTSDTRLTEVNKKEILVYSEDNIPSIAQIDKGLQISVNLQGNTVSDIIGYRAKRDTPIIDLERIDYYEAQDFWDIVHTPRNKGIILNPGDFYILGSKEKIRVPEAFAAEMVPFDPSLGEFRIHYAGFFDPGFGYGHNDIKGTPAVLEVRAHEVPFLIEDGQTVGRLIYIPLLGPPDKVYGAAIGSSYQHQILSLSKQFKQYRLKRRRG